MTLGIDAKARQIDRFIAFSAKMGAVVFGTIMSVVFAALYFLDVRDAFILPIMFIAAISCLAYIIESAALGINHQILNLTDALVDGLKSQKAEL